VGVALVAGVGTAVVAAAGRGPEVMDVVPADGEPPAVVSTPAPPPKGCVVPDGDRTERAWLTKGGGSRVTGAATDLLDERFGAAAKSDRQTRLRNGLIGLTLDYAKHEVVIVVDPALVDIPALDKDLQRVTANALKSRPNPDATARIQAGCHSSADLAAAHDTIMGMRAEFGYPSMGVSMDEHVSAWEVTTGSQDFADALHARLGDLVRTSCCFEFGW
jgi:hypothetical protein